METISKKQLLWALSYLKPYFVGLFGVLILTFGQNYSMAMLPSVSTSFLWELINPEKIHLLYKYFIIAVGLILGKALFNFLQRYSMRIITLSAIKNMRDDFFNHLIKLDLGFFKKNKTGNIISIGINDIEAIRIDLYQGITNFISNLMMLIILLTRLLLLNWRLTIISLSVMPILYILIKILGDKMKYVNKNLRKNLSELSNNFHEIITGIEVVKAFAQEDNEYENFKNNTSKYKRNFLKLVKLEMIFSPLSEAIIYIYGILLAGIGAYFIITGSWTARGLTEYLMVLGLLAGPITKLPKFITNYKTVSVSIDRVYKVVFTEPKVKEIENPIERKIEGYVDFKNVYFRYEEEKYVLKNVSFNVNKGDIIALVGPSGAGKTSIANLIPRYYDCERGEILIDKINVKNYSLKNLRSQIGMVSQNIFLFNNTILENIKYARRNSTDEEVVEAAKKAYAYDFIMEMPQQFMTNIGERGIKLSGGQKQRISIARAILMDPQILILDEATSSLDSESEYYIQLAVNNLMKDRTSIIIAHRLSTIKHATKIIVIENGQIIAIGKHDELLSECNLYKKMYNLQFIHK